MYVLWKFIQTFREYSFMRGTLLTLRMGKMVLFMEKEKQVELLHKTIHGVLKAFSNSIKDGSDYIPVNSYVPENFYKGTEKFLKNPSKNGKWSLGYANV